MTFEEWVQSRLTAHGYPCGPIDGIFGPATRAALKHFQAAHQLDTSGVGDAATVLALRKPSSRVPVEEKQFIPDRDRDGPDDGRRSVWPRQRDVPQFFGPVGRNQTRLEVPWDMVLAWKTDISIRTITVHEKVAASAERAFHRIRGIYSTREIKALGLHLFGGSLNVRRMRGGSRYSMHSWGIAIDFDPARNRLSWKRPRARLSRDDAVPFFQAFEAEGWLSLGRARNFDWMHVQAARL
ncbi:MAG: peptidoglycan-binding protein [Roseibium sp.]|nr:peptidoglycan-binding protein [Roseibium sp.]